MVQERMDLSTTMVCRYYILKFKTIALLFLKLIDFIFSSGQQFGSGSIPTHLVGAALLRGEWKVAVNLILDPREGDILQIFYMCPNQEFVFSLASFCLNITKSVQRDDINEVRKRYKEHGDIDMALRNFPRHLVAERAIVSIVNLF